MFSFSILIQVFQHGSWAKIQELEVLEFIEIVRQLSSTVLRSRVESSTKKYMGAFRC